MSFRKKVLLIVLLVILNGSLISGIKVEKIQWQAFLPKTLTNVQMENALLDKQKQYLFCHSKDIGQINELKKTGVVEEYFEIPLVDDTYIFIFDADKMSQVLNKTKDLQRSGTVLVGNMVFKDFYDEILDYTFTIVPILLILLLFLIPLRLWIDILLEMALYTLLLVLVLRLGIIEINSASLLSLVFLIIYSLTLINYLYSEGMDFKRLFLGIQISIMATIVSAVFLIYSNFGLIHSFGEMLLLGLIVLHLYMSVRIYFRKYFRHSYHSHRFDALLNHTFLHQYKGFFLVMVLLLLGSALMLQKNFSIDLNIVNILSKNSPEIIKINDFEKEVIPSLPFVIKIKTKEKNFADTDLAKQLLSLEEDIEKECQLSVLESFSHSFKAFRQLAKDKNDPNLVAQFLLANSFVKQNMELFTADMSSSLMIVSIPLTMSSQKIIVLKKKILAFTAKYPYFEINIEGKVADFDKYLEMFLEEFALGLLVTLLLSGLFFLFYCKNILSFFIIFASMFFSLSILLYMHILFNKPLSLVTLMSIILYAGLIADSLIQLFICYNSAQTQCERSVLHPIFVSNAAILIFLFGMFFVEGILASFAFEMTVLLVSNLIFVLWLLPYIHDRYPKVCSGSKQIS